MTITTQDLKIFLRNAVLKTLMAGSVFVVVSFIAIVYLGIPAEYVWMFTLVPMMGTILLSRYVVVGDYDLAGNHREGNELLKMPAKKGAR